METNLTTLPTEESAVPLNHSGILFMDTDVVQQKLVSKMLAKIGCPVFFAENYRQALSILDANTIDLILLDAKMRKSNGYDITQIAREKEKIYGKRIPIVLMVEKVMKQHREQCRADGLDDCLPKPVFENELCRVIEKLSGNNGSQEVS